MAGDTKDSEVIEIELDNAAQHDDTGSEDSSESGQRKHKHHGAKLQRIHTISYGKCMRPATFAFYNVCFSVKLKKETKQILKDISAIVRPGEFLGILGPSGAGKTTLLDILSHRMRPTSGDIYLNGVRLSIKQFRRASAYVPQNDIFSPTLTVRETLLFYARCKLPSSISSAQLKKRVDDILEEFNLTKVRHTFIGNEFIRGISGGEKRRVSIAVEMITEPSLLFLDEPTSGLDASTAFSIMETIINLARSGRTVICTIHQPRSQIFQMFDRMMLLCNGEVAYCGKAKDAVDYFQHLDFPCPIYTNPADHFLDLVTPIGETEEGSVQKNIDKLTTEHKEALTANPLEKVQSGDKKAVKKKYVYKIPTGFFVQLLVLLWRNFLGIVRNPLVLKVRIIQCLFTAILMGLVFLRLGYNQTDIQSRLGLLGFLTISTVFTITIATVQVFPLERALFMRDRSSEVYRVSSFYLAKLISELPLYIVLPAIQGTITYWMANLNPGADRFFIFLADFILICNVSLGLGLALSAVAPSPAIGTMLGPLVVVIFVLFSGFFANTNDIPVVFIWLPWTSLVKHAWSAFTINEFRGEVFECDSSSGSGISKPCIRDGQQEIDLLNLSNDQIYINFGVLIALYFIFHFIAYCVLALKDWFARRK